MKFGSQWDYPHEIDANGNIVRRLYIYWISAERENYLIGKIENIIAPPDTFYRIEYFEEGLEYCSKHFYYFDRIPGCPYEKYRVFEYKNRVPVFILERTPNPRRADLPDLLEAVGMELYDRFEYMRRTNAATMNNAYFVHESPNAFDFKGTFRHTCVWGEES